MTTSTSSLPTMQTYFVNYIAASLCTRCNDVINFRDYSKDFFGLRMCGAIVTAPFYTLGILCVKLTVRL